MKTILLAVFALTLLMPVGAQAQDDPFSNVQSLRKNCREIHKTLTGFACLGFLEGTYRMMDLVASMAEVGSDERKFLGVCPSVRPTGGQMLQIFLNWADTNPTEWQHGPSVGVVIAFARAFPCN